MDSPLGIFWRGYNKGLSCFYLISSAGLTERVAGLYGLRTLNINLLTLCSPHSHLQTNFRRSVSFSVFADHFSAGVCTISSRC